MGRLRDGCLGICGPLLRCEEPDDPSQESSDPQSHGLTRAPLRGIGHENLYGSLR